MSGATPSPDGHLLLRVGALALLLLLNGFLVASEVAIATARTGQVDEQAESGDRQARALRRLIRRLERSFIAVQLGITASSLGVGWLAADTLASAAMVSGAARGLAAAAAFAMLTAVHVVLAELVPRGVALAAPTGTSRVVARPFLIFARLVWPLTWLLAGVAARLVRLAGLQPAPGPMHVHTPEELRTLVIQSRAHGKLAESDSAMIAGVLDFHEKRAEDVMRPRTEVAALEADLDEEAVREVVRRERYSRYPVHAGSLDEIIGVFLATDLWLRDESRPFDLRALLRPAIFIPGTRPAERVLDDLRRSRAQMAVVLDEYGGTAGIITMEDLVEEVVGDIADEYDLATRTALEADGVLELAGSLSLIDVRSDHRLRIQDGEWTTLGGYVFASLGRLPRLGDRVPFPGGELEVTAMDARRVAAVRVHRAAGDDGVAPEERA